LTFDLLLLKSNHMQLFGTSGIRRLVDADLIRLAFQVGLAAGTLYKNVVIGRDTRTSGSSMRHALTSGLLAAGARCSDAGIVPTPTLAFITREFDAGIMITASHNPPQYNGMKMLNPDGSAFSSKQQSQIEDLIEKPDSLKIRWDKMLPGEVYSTALEKHIERITRDFPGGIKLRVVVDCGCGAAYFITPHLLTQLGCEVISLNCYPDGIFPHDVEPVEANLGDLMQAVKDHRADLGIAHDGDADRMMAVDELGRFISGDKLLTIFAEASGKNHIVTTVDASMCIDRSKFRVKRTKVGDPYVSEALKKGGDFGGEPSGAWVFPGISLCPDGIFAAAQIADIASRCKLSQLVYAIPSYPVIRGNIPGTLPSLDDLKKKLLVEFAPESSDLTDGLKIYLKNGWLLVRPSGTEPKIRLTAEATTSALVKSYYEKGAKIISDFIRERK
jgi:phosphoglucosamine mutase